MKARSIIVIALIILFLFAAYGITRYMQKIIHPRESLAKFFLYLLCCLVLIFALSFLMVFIITRFFPAELIK